MGDLWGRRGAAIDPEGRVFLGTGDAEFDPLTRRLGNGIVGVKLDDKKQLQLTDYFGAPNANWLWRRDLDVNTTPVVIDYRRRKFLVGTSKECRLWLLDREGLGGEDHRTTVHTTPLLCNDAQAFDARGIWGALGAWVDDAGTQWVLAPFWGPVSTTFKAPIEHARPAGGGVAAYKLEERAGKWQLTPAWLSRDMDLAEETVIANGIVFAYAAGEDASQVMPDKAWDEPGGPVYGGGLSSGPARRIPTSRRAALYALDGQTGKELWSSGNQIESWNHFSGLDRRERTRVYRDLRRYPLLLRHRPLAEVRSCALNVCCSWSSLLDCAALAGSITFAQPGRGGSQWLTALADAQRTSWVRTDDKISVAALSKPGFELQWKNEARQPAPRRARPDAGRDGERRDALRADVDRRRQLEQRLRDRQRHRLRRVAAAFRRRPARCDGRVRRRDHVCGDPHRPAGLADCCRRGWVRRRQGPWRRRVSESPRRAW